MCRTKCLIYRDFLDLLFASKMPSKFGALARGYPAPARKHSPPRRRPRPPRTPGGPRGRRGTRGGAQTRLGKRKTAKNSPARSHSIGLVGDLSHCNTALMTSIRHYHNPPTRIIRIFGYCTASKLGPPLTTVRGAPRRYKQ